MQKVPEKTKKLYVGPLTSLGGLGCQAVIMFPTSLPAVTLHCWAEVLNKLLQENIKSFMGPLYSMFAFIV